MTDVPNLNITPEPSADDRDAIFAAVSATLAREASIARPATWRLAGWVDQRAGITDFGASVTDARRWVLSARLPRGGRLFPGLNGRGDAR